MTAFVASVLMLAAFLASLRLLLFGIGLPVGEHARTNEVKRGRESFRCEDVALAEVDDEARCRFVFCAEQVVTVHISKYDLRAAVSAKTLRLLCVQTESIVTGLLSLETARGLRICFELLRACYVEAG